MDFVSAVVAAGWANAPVTPVGPTPEQSTRLRFQPTEDDEVVVGVDIGGTKILVSAWGQGGITEHRVELADRANTDLVDFVLKAINHCIGDQKLKALTIGVPGVVDQDHGSLGIAPNLPGWESINIAETFSSRLRVPVEVENDVNLAAYGEFIWRSSQDMTFIAIGTGIGGGIVIDGEIVHGNTGAAGEVFDIPVPGVDPTQLRPVEDIACGPGLENLYTEIAGQPLSPPEILRRINSDAAAEQAVDVFGRSVAILVSAIHGILEPDLVVIGGGLGVQDEILRSIDAHLQAFKRRSVRVEPSLLEARASTLGALARAAQLAK